MTMKLFAFRIHKPWTNVQVWEWREVQLGLFEVLRTDLVSALPVPDPGRSALQTLSELADSVRPIAFRSPDGDTVRLPRALIVATSFVDLLDFLLASYVPQGDGAIRSEIGGVGYLTAYWMGRYHGFIGEAEANREWWKE